MVFISSRRDFLWLGVAVVGSAVFGTALQGCGGGGEGSGSSNSFTTTTLSNNNSSGGSGGGNTNPQPLEERFFGPYPPASPNYSLVARQRMLLGDLLTSQGREVRRRTTSVGQRVYYVAGVEDDGDNPVPTANTTSWYFWIVIETSATRDTYFLDSNRLSDGQIFNITLEQGTTLIAAISELIPIQ